MNDTKTIIKNRFFEIGKTSMSSYLPNSEEHFVVFYHKKLSEWFHIIGIKFRQYGYYIMFKKFI